MQFKLVSQYTPKGDQPQAIDQLTKGIKSGRRDQTLLGVTGSGKTFTMAGVIENVQKPTLIISHNKTLAAQLYQEFKEFFPENGVHYFVSYYDYYQPESYLPTSDTFIEKESVINEQVSRLRHAATQSILTRQDTIIVASVSCIYGIGSPEDYGNMALVIEPNMIITRDDFIKRLIEIQYSRNDIDFKPGCFRVKGDVVEIHSPGEELIIKVSFWGNTIENIALVEYQDTILKQLPAKYTTYFLIFPATHWISTQEKVNGMVQPILDEMEQRKAFFLKHNKLIEAQRIEERTKYDMEMLKEIGYIKSIENYSRYMTGRAPGEPPYTLIDYFHRANPDFLIMVDESHISLPQVSGMYNGDAARKKNLIDFGFRLPSAADNRPLKFTEFEQKIPQIVYVSATPRAYEFEHSSDGKIHSIAEVTDVTDLVQVGVAQQIIRPTGLIEPKIEIRQIKDQMKDLIQEIHKTVALKQRILVTTLTKRMAEDISEFLKDEGIKAEYLHSEIDTLERPEILKKLRLGEFDVLIGINLLREGLDLPEVALVAILDADKEGFLRNETSLIQTIGRAARHQEGRVILYADVMTKSINRAISETDRRRKIQLEYNTKHGITPTTIMKGIRDSMVKEDKPEEYSPYVENTVSPEEKEYVITELEKQMKKAAKDLDFETAARLRDDVKKIKES